MVSKATPTSLVGIPPPRGISPVLGSPEPEVGLPGGEDVSSVSKKTNNPSTKTSFEMFKKQAMEKTERVRVGF